MKKNKTQAPKNFIIETDTEWADVHRQVDEDAIILEMTDMDALVAWQLGLSAWKTAKRLGVKFPHD